MDEKGMSLIRTEKYPEYKPPMTPLCFTMSTAHSSIPLYFPTCKFCLTTSNGFRTIAYVASAIDAASMCCTLTFRYPLECLLSRNLLPSYVHQKVAAHGKAASIPLRNPRYLLTD